MSETWYTWIISISSIGELLGAVVYGVLSRRVYVKWLLLSSILSAFLGGLLFGIGKYGWMLLIGKVNLNNFFFNLWYMHNIYFHMGAKFDLLNN